MFFTMLFKNGQKFLLCLDIYITYYTALRDMTHRMAGVQGQGLPYLTLYKVSVSVWGILAHRPTLWPGCLAWELATTWTGHYWAQGLL